MKEKGRCCNLCVISVGSRLRYGYDGGWWKAVIETV